MICASLALLLAASSSAETAAAGRSDPRPLEKVGADAERAFAEGTKARSDAEAARRFFREAARDYDEVWQRGGRNPALAVDRSRAHRLAGDLPAAIAALHEGLAAARYDRALEVELEDARAAVAYSHDDIASLCRPKPAGGIGSRMSPLEAYLAAGLLWLVTCLGITRFAMTRVPGWLLISGIGGLCLLVLGGLWWRDWRHQANEHARPLVIVTDDTALKAGNGETWPDRLKWRLPRGVEARELTRRGGWVQVELAGGFVGWLPERKVISSKD
jgi:hypothetical protein